MLKMGNFSLLLTNNMMSCKRLQGPKMTNQTWGTGQLLKVYEESVNKATNRHTERDFV